MVGSIIVTPDGTSSEGGPVHNVFNNNVVRELLRMIRGKSTTVLRNVGSIYYQVGILYERPKNANEKDCDGRPRQVACLKSQMLKL